MRRLRGGYVWLTFLGMNVTACTGDLDGTTAKPPVDPPSETLDCVQKSVYFAEKVWPVLSKHCVGCHAPGGLATENEDPAKRARFVLQWDAYPNFLTLNERSLERMVIEQVDGIPKLLLKPLGGDGHTGGVVLDAGSAEYEALKNFTRSVQGKLPECSATAEDPLALVELADFAETFRRAALSLAGRLPKPQGPESVILDEGQFDAALDALMTEAAFFERVKAMYNDVLLTEGGGRVQTGVFQFVTEDYPAVKPRKEGPQTSCAAAVDPEQCARDFIAFWTRAEQALRDEPLELIANVVRKGAPFSEVLTADYTMVNPYLAHIYGLGPSFSAPSSASEGEWKEMKVTGLLSGPVAHAGVLTTPAFLGRWVSTTTNVNRARARRVFAAFLATDVLKLAQRPVDTSALTAVANAPRNASACSVCHQVFDSVANSFSNFPDSSAFDYDPEISAATTPHSEMLPPGFEGEVMPGSERNMLGWLASRIAQDPRFALSVAHRVYTALTGREPLRYPEDDSSPDFAEQLRAFQAEDAFLRNLAKVFQDSNQSLKEVVRATIKSPFFRAKSVPESVGLIAARLGGGTLLGPELLDARLRATFGFTWGVWEALDRYRSLVNSEFAVPLGGINSFEVTTRLQDVNPMTSSVVDRMANEMACRSVGWDFTKAAQDRLLFPHVEVASVPGTDDAAIRLNATHILERVLGPQVAADPVEVDAAVQLFHAAYAAAQMDAEQSIPYACLGVYERDRGEWYSCGTAGNPDYREQCYVSFAAVPEDRAVSSDEFGTLAAWMAVVSYVVSDYRFIYQ